MPLIDADFSGCGVNETFTHSAREASRMVTARHGAGRPDLADSPGIRGLFTTADLGSDRSWSPVPPLAAIWPAAAVVPRDGGLPVNEVTHLMPADAAERSDPADDWDELEIRVEEVAVRVEHQRAGEADGGAQQDGDGEPVSSRLVLSGRAGMRRRDVGFLDHADVQIMHSQVPASVTAMREDAFGILELQDEISATLWLTQDDYRRMTSGIDYAAEYRRPAITLRLRLGPRMPAVPTKGRYAVYWWGINVARIVGE